MTITDLFFTQDLIPPFRLRSVGQPRPLARGHVLHPFELKKADHSLANIAFIEHASLCLAYPGMTVSDLASIKDGSLDGLTRMTERLLSGDISAFRYRLLVRDEGLSEHQLKTVIIPKLLAANVEVCAFQELDTLTLYAASPEPLARFYDLTFIQTVFEWRAELWAEPFQADCLAKWEQLLPTCSVATLVANLFTTPNASSDLTLLQPGEWFMTDSDARSEFQTHYFPDVMDVHLFLLFFNGFPLEFAMGQLHKLYEST